MFVIKMSGCWRGMDVRKKEKGKSIEISNFSEFPGISTKKQNTKSGAINLVTKLLFKR
jgi:hypothetical protein